jgi:hypothetical protein
MCGAGASPAAFDLFSKISKDPNQLQKRRARAPAPHLQNLASFARLPDEDIWAYVDRI